MMIAKRPKSVETLAVRLLRPENVLCLVGRAPSAPPHTPVPLKLHHFRCVDIHQRDMQLGTSEATEVQPIYLQMKQVFVFREFIYTSFSFGAAD